ncbi:2-dehydropantoate 2-reductase (Ketopantoate reductase) (KPA reductase) (KPR) [Sporothrix bragantina]|uniref:2-dehydropantoate 2-reductase (Ketopantoate reductase) (KPA reductase) (KPR) n=1 Tax=Sporothrix bragantina TaxID=671064 RepID=A0ABP0CT07_9PEZI
MSSKAASSPTVPAWLSHTLKDKAPGPRIYRWKPDDVAGQSGASLRKRAPADDKRIYIVGMGNLGRLFAASLARLPNRPPITLVVHRPGLLEQWRTEPGVVLHPPGYVEGNAASEDARITDFDVEMWSEKPPPASSANKNVDVDAEISPITNLVIATKAQDALRTADWVRRYLGPNSAVAFAQNGMNKLWPPYGALYNEARYSVSDQSLQTRPPLWLACIVTHGVYSVGPFASVHASPADVVLGAVDGNNTKDGNDAYLVRQILAASQLKARWAPRNELWVLQLEKLVVNAVINPLTAILRCKNGALFVPDDTPNAVLPRVIDQLLQEASAVLRALAQHEIKTGNVFKDLSSTEAASALAKRLSFDSLRAMVYRVGELVKNNSSSMFQDAQAGKKTEVGEFNGWIVDMARYLESVGATDGESVNVKTHQIMVDLVEKAVLLTKEELAEHFAGK